MLWTSLTKIHINPDAMMEATLKNCICLKGFLIKAFSNDSVLAQQLNSTS